MRARVGFLPVVLSVALLTNGVAQAQGKRNGALLPGADSKQPINIEAGKLDYFDKEQKLIYTGSVVATQGASKLTSSVLTILLAPKSGGAKKDSGGGGASSNQIQHMDATGPVTMVQRDQVGTGEHAVYDKASDTIVMTGNVVLTQGENVTKGDKLVYDLKTGHATVTGQRVVGMFKTGGDASTPATTRNSDAGEGDDDAPNRKAPRKSSSR